MNRYKITCTHDAETTPRHTFTYADERDAFKDYFAFKDWGFADEYLTVNLSTPTGKMYTKIFYRKDRKVVEK